MVLLPELQHRVAKACYRVPKQTLAWPHTAMKKLSTCIPGTASLNQDGGRIIVWFSSEPRMATWRSDLWQIPSWPHSSSLKQCWNSALLRSSCVLVKALHWRRLGITSRHFGYFSPVMLIFWWRHLRIIILWPWWLAWRMTRSILRLTAWHGSYSVTWNCWNCDIPMVLKLLTSHIHFWKKSTN